MHLCHMCYNFVPIIQFVIGEKAPSINRHFKDMDSPLDIEHLENEMLLNSNDSGMSFFLKL
jgi:hypothetical protein